MWVLTREVHLATWRPLADTFYLPDRVSGTGGDPIGYNIYMENLK